MKILIIGLAGFIGRFLSRKLANSGHEIVGLDVNRPDQEHQITSFVQGNVLNPTDVTTAAENVDAIINLAAKHHDFGISRAEYFEANAQGTENILACAARLGIRKLLFFSTAAVYGNGFSCATETTPPSPVSDYGESKLAAERIICKWAAEDHKREAAIIRPTVVFGPYNYGNMYTLINNIHKKRFLFVGKGENIKSLAYVEGLVDATAFLLERLGPGVEVYNYVDYPQLTSAQIVETLSHLLSSNLPRIKIPLRPAMIAATGFDLLGKLTGHNFPITAKRIKKFNAATCYIADKIRESGFKPPVDLFEGFRRTIEWYLAEDSAKKTPVCSSADASV